MKSANLSNYVGREQAYVKHYLLEKYLEPFIYKVGRAWESIVYIDGFAGPWGVSDPDLADSSFAIAIDTLGRARKGMRETWGRSLNMQAVLVEKSRPAFSLLSRFANSVQNEVNVKAINGSFADKIGEIDRIVADRCPRPFRFVFLDPKGWKDIPMVLLQPFLRDRSCEVLISLMTKDINRFLEEESRADSYNNLFGDSSVLEKLRAIPKESKDRPEQAVKYYCQSLKKLCQFKYVSSAVIMEPEVEGVRYFLVYATNDIKGIEVFKRAEMDASRIQDEVRHESRMQRTQQNEFLFDSSPPKSRLALRLHQKYISRSRRKILEMLLDNTDAKGISYESLFAEAMAFPLVRPEDLQEWIKGLAPNISIKFFKPGSQKPSAESDDRILVLDRDALKRLVLEK